MHLGAIECGHLRDGYPHLDDWIDLYGRNLKDLSVLFPPLAN